MSAKEEKLELGLQLSSVVELRGGDIAPRTRQAHGSRVGTLIRAVHEALRLAVLSCNGAVSLAFLRATGRASPIVIAAVVKRFLLRMGPLYMKVGQVFGTQSGLISKEAADEFRSFFSDLPAQSDAHTRAILAQPEHRPLMQALIEMNWKPLAVGSVAQVHRGKLNDGRHVAIKIVKRGVRDRLESGAAVLMGIIRVLHCALPAVRRMNLPAHFAELRPLLLEQTNMKRELLNIGIAQRNFLNHPFARVPTVLEHFSTNDVLVMEFIDGVQGQDYSAVTFPKSQLARRLQDIFYTMAYFHGSFHVDPHPGNFIFANSGEVTLLDFGLLGELQQQDKMSLSSFHYACMQGDWDLAVRRFTSAFVADPGDVYNMSSDYRSSMANVLRKHYVDRTARWSTMSFFDDANRELRRFDLRFSTHFALLAIATLTGEGFLSIIDESLDLWANARKFIDRYSPYMSNEIRKRFDEYFEQTIPKSLARRRQAAQSLIATTHFDRYVLPSTYPIIVQSASGCRVRDIDGNEYVDLSCGFGPHILGYAHPVIVKAVCDATHRGAVNAFGNEAQIRLAELILSGLRGADRVVLTNSGTESMITACRIARAFTRKQKVAKFEGHYHGFADQAMVSSFFNFRGSDTNPQPMEGSPGSHRCVVDDTIVLQYGAASSLDVLERQSAQIAAVIVEPLPGASVEYDADFLRALRDICTRKKILLIFDEVVTGFRATFGGVQDLLGIYPDLTCLGKVIGGGLPCGGVAGRGEVMEVARTSHDPFLDLETKAFSGGTMSGNSVACAAGCAALEFLSAHREIYETLASNSKWLVDTLTQHTRDLNVPSCIKGNLSIFSLTFDHAKPRTVRQRLAGSNFKANVALAYYMRKHQTYVPELHTMLIGAAHGVEDLQHVAQSFRNSVAEMVEDGYFVV